MKNVEYESVTGDLVSSIYARVIKRLCDCGFTLNMYLRNFDPTK